MRAKLQEEVLRTSLNLRYPGLLMLSWYRKAGWLASSSLLFCACTFDTSTRQAGDPGPSLVDASLGMNIDGSADATPIVPDAQCPFDSAELCADPDPALIIDSNEVFNTDSDARCRSFAQAGGPETCLLLVDGFTISQDVSFRARGKRPLVIASTGSIDIIGTLDLASYLTGPGGAGHNSTDCSPGSQAEDDLGGGAGGAGGSFAGSGGDGGEGDTDDSLGDDDSASPSIASAATGQPAYVRGGCAGTKGGDERSSGGNGGAGGKSGGAVHLRAIGALRIHASGVIRATGAGGGGGEVQAGGGGGGSGGYIKLSASVINNEGFLSANGGGGGEGGIRSNNIDYAGGDGENGQVNGTVAIGGSGLLNGGNGGNGSAGTFPAEDGDDSGRGAGGGGGATGLILTQGTSGGNGESSPSWVAL